MEGRKLGAGLLALASSMLLLVGTASAHGTVAPQTTPSSKGCTVKSLPSFMAQGEFYQSATVGDVIEVSCDPYTYSAGAQVEIVASQLYSRCGDYLTWYKPNENGQDEITSGRSVTLRLDVNGNANVALIAGPHCMVGESLISVDEVESPYETFTTSFQIETTKDTPEGLELTPSSQVEDQESSGVVTIAQAEFPGNSEAHVRIGAGQLFDRCQNGDHLEFVKMNREVVEEYKELLDAIELDNNGNGFVVLMGTDSCAAGTSLIEADLEGAGYNTAKGFFTVESPRERPEGK